MNYSNYTLFEIIKYKIEFLECLDYTLISNPNEDKDIKNHLIYLKNELNKGLYKEIVSTLFTSFNLLNKPIINFIKRYNYKKIIKLKSCKKLKYYLDFNEKIIECYETFNYIICSFTEEEKIYSKLDKRILDLINISKNHFNNFLFFNFYNLYLNCFYNKEKNLIYKRNDIKRLVSFLTYCNKESKFNNYIEVLKSENINKINEELEKLSNDCIKSEQNQFASINEIISIINSEVKNKQS